MKKYSVFNLLRLSLIVLLAAAGCRKDPVEPANISLDRSSVSANKRGMTYEGGEVSFNVTSNVYWVINVPKDAEEWLALSPRAAYGNQTVKVIAQMNTGGERSAVLTFDSMDGVTAEIEVTQGAYGELIYFVRTDAGSTAVSGEVAVKEFSGWNADGIGGVSDITFSGVNAAVSSSNPSSGYDGASGGNNIHLNIPAGAETNEASFIVNGVDTRGDLYFRLKFGVMSESGTIAPPDLLVQVNNGGDEYVDLNYEVTGSGDWKEALARFYVGADDTNLSFRIITATGEYYIDDFRLYEGNAGDGQEVVFQITDDGQEAGYSYFEDDFGWVTAVYGGTDYIGGYPSASAETFWNNITAAAYGDEAYNAFNPSGWLLGDNALKQRTYLRIGYVKFGRAANAAGSGGSLMTPPLDKVKKNSTTTLKVSFDCCIFVGTTGTWDPNSMQVRVLGPGSINDETSAVTAQAFYMQTGVMHQWETKEFLVYGATNATQIVFESVEETAKANRLFLDNVRIVKASASDKPPVDLVPLNAPVAKYEETDSVEPEVKFSWSAIVNAASYEYEATLKAGQITSTKTGTVTGTELTLTDLIAGSTCDLRVRALPAGGDAVYKESDWSESVTGIVRAAVIPPDPDIDSHEVGFAFVDDDLSWITYAMFGNQESFVDNFPSSVAGLRFDSASTEGKALLASKGWATTAAGGANSGAYVYEGCVKLGTASAVGSVFSPKVSAIDAGAKVNAAVTVGGTAFLGTNSVYDDDHVKISIEGEGMFDDGTKSREYHLKAWNDWLRQSFVVMGIDNQTRFKLETLTAAKGRVMFNYFSVVKLADDYNPAAQLPVLATPADVTISNSTAYGFDASWTAVENATDYDYWVVNPNGRIVVQGKTWEPRVHVGNLAGKNISSTYLYFNFRVAANHMNYDSGKLGIPQTYDSSQSSSAVKAAITAATATVYFQDDFSWFMGTSSVLLETNTDWVNTYCVVDAMDRFDTLVTEGTLDMHGWGYDATNKAVYARPGYVQVNSGSAVGQIVSPALTAISGTDNVKVSFDAGYFYQYFSQKGDTNRVIQATLRGAGSIDGATGGVLELTLARGSSWEGLSFNITGADATTQVVLGAKVASSNRWFLDNFRVESTTH